MSIERCQSVTIIETALASLDEGGLAKIVSLAKNARANFGV